MRELTEEELRAHEAAYQRGWSLMEGHVFLHETGPIGPPGWFARRRLRRAIKCFLEALAIHPSGWPSMWAIGKIHQRLGEHEDAFDRFSAAHSLEPEQADVAREASLAALDLGRADDAIRMGRAAAASAPDDPGLVCNLALAYCLAGRDDEAEDCARQAVDRDAADRISADVLTFVRDVASGKRARPERLSDVFPHG